jgi:hypothetical protein
MDMSGFTSPSDKPARSTDTLEYGTALLQVAHALADNVLYSEENMASFAALLERTDVEELRAEIQGAHDAFATMAARASVELSLTRLLGESTEMPDLPNLDTYGI